MGLLSYGIGRSPTAGAVETVVAAQNHRRALVATRSKAT
jgi:hypothetical protein